MEPSPYGFVGDPNSLGGGSGGKGLPATGPEDVPAPSATKGPGRGGGGGRYYGFLVFAGNY